MPERMRRWYLWLLLSLAIVLLDQFTKMLVVRNLALFERVPLLPYLDLVRLHNPGAAFSFLASASGWQVWLFTGIALVVSAGIIWWLARLGPGQRTLALGLVLILGGAVGNLIDRLMHGYVVDFVLLHYGRWSWPAFNVADAAISCGVALVLVDGLVLERRRARRPQRS